MNKTILLLFSRISNAPAFPGSRWPISTERDDAKLYYSKVEVVH